MSPPPSLDDDELPPGVAWPSRLWATFRRWPPLWIVPALLLLFAACLLPSSWATELRPGFTQARVFVPARFALVLSGVGASCFWGPMLAEHWGIPLGVRGFRLTQAPTALELRFVKLIHLSAGLLLCYGAPLWLIFR